MSTVRDLLRQKRAGVVSVAPTTTVLEAAHLMNERGIGCVVVVEDGHLRGIFTERDVLRRIVAATRDPATTRMSEVMTTSLVTCEPTTPIEVCAATMTAQRIRHLPVIGPAGVEGVVSSRDVLAYQLADHAATIQQLHSYVFDNR